MVYIELLIVLLAIFVGARVGGIGLGIFGMMGLGVLVFEGRSYLHYVALLLFKILPSVPLFIKS